MASRLDARGESKQTIRVLDGWLENTNPRDVEVLLYKGYILDSMHQFAAALRVYRQVLRVSPNNPPALVAIGSYHSNIRRDDRRALRYFAQALRMIEAGQAFADEEDEFIDACTETAGALLALHRPLAALKCLVRGLQKYPTHTRLGDALQRAQAKYHQVREKGLGMAYFKFKRRYARLHTAKKQL